MISLETPEYPWNDRETLRAAVIAEHEGRLALTKLILAGLLEKATGSNSPVECRRYTVSDVLADEVREAIESTRAIRLYTETVFFPGHPHADAIPTSRPRGSVGNGEVGVWALPDGLISVARERGTIYLMVMHAEEASLSSIHPKLSALNERSSRETRVLMLQNIGDSVRFMTLGKVTTTPLERGNYEPALIERFDHAINDMTSPTPCGRVVLIDGPPGTGKTYLVRALMSQVDATFIILPPAMAAELTGPNLLSCLMSAKNEYGDRPLVIVLEDADACLAPRKFDNMGSVSELLNLGDGIVGSTLDIRIVATTNTPKAEIDKAILRPGRLCARLNVTELSSETADKVLERLGASQRSGGKKLSLGEIYKMAGDERKAG